MFASGLVPEHLSALALGSGFEYSIRRRVDWFSHHLVSEVWYLWSAEVVDSEPASSGVCFCCAA